MKYADKINAKFSCIVGDNELEVGVVKVKRMETGEAYEVRLDEMVEFMLNA